MNRNVLYFFGDEGVVVAKSIDECNCVMFIKYYCVL